MDANMKAVIDLEIQNFKAKAIEAQKEINKLKKEIIDAEKVKLASPKNIELLEQQDKKIKQNTDAIKEQRIALSSANIGIKENTLALKQAGLAQQQFRNQAGASNAIALEFNRIIQDAPFGIIGVGNNIQQLAGQFSQLSSAGKSTGVIIKEAFASIISPANLVLLGVSAVTSAFTAYKLGVFDSKEETKSLNNSLQEYRETLDSLTSASLTGQQNAQKEIGNLQLLRTQAESTNVSQEKRLEAVRDLKKEYPQYLRNLTDEQILTGKVGDSYEKLAKSIIATAKARAAQDKIAENSLNILTLEEQKAEKQIEINNLRQKSLTATTKDIDVAARVAGQFTATVDNLTPILTSIRIAEEERRKIDEQINGLKNEELKLTGFINERIKEGANFTEASKEKLKGVVDNAEKLKRVFEDINKLPEIGLPRLGDLEALLEKRKRLEEGGFLEQKPEIRAIPLQESEFQRNLQEFPLRVPTIPDLEKQIENLTALRNALKITDVTGIQQYNVQISLLQEKLKQLTGDKEIVKQTNDLTRSLSDAFSAMAQQISASLNISNDSLKAFVGTLLSQTPKIIGAIARTVAANRAATAEGTKLSLKQALANGIVTGTEGAKALGPIGLALLPVFVGGAMALISGAFKKAGINAPGGGAGSAIRSAGANAVGSSITGAGQSFDLFGDLQLSTFIRGTNIELVLERVNQQRRA